MSTKKSWKTFKGTVAPPMAPALELAEALRRQVVMESAKLTDMSAMPLSSVMRAGCQSMVSGKNSRTRVTGAAAAALIVALGCRAVLCYSFLCHRGAVGHAKRPCL